jgi:nucleotide-binding universal stress UspA family protein
MAIELMQPYSAILVAYDGSDGAQAALARVAGLASRGASVTIASSVGEFEGEPHSVTEPVETEHNISAAERHLDEAAARLPESIERDLRVVHGHPPEALLALADEVGADLIVMGSRGPAMLRQGALGRVSSTLVNSARCDVLVVQPYGARAR